MNTRRQALLGLSLSLTLSLGSGAAADSPSEPKAAKQECTGDCRDELEAARAGTEDYHDVDVALADGYVSTVQCVEVPGLGAMGIHYASFSRMTDGVVDAAEPELLLFLPDRQGNLHLVGVEYFAPVLSGGVPWFGPTPPPTIDNPAPILFGRAMDGPEPGRGPGQPWHYELHAWIWRQNPISMFTPFNPKLACGE